MPYPAGGRLAPERQFYEILAVALCRRLDLSKEVGPTLLARTGMATLILTRVPTRPGDKGRVWAEEARHNLFIFNIK